MLNCVPDDGVLTVEVTLDSDVSMVVEAVTVRPADVAFSDVWESLPLIAEIVEEGTNQVELASGPLEPGLYHHVFVDVTDIEHDGFALEDIVEPIAAPFEMDERSRRMVVELMTYELPSGELGLFAVDTDVD